MHFKSNEKLKDNSKNGKSLFNMLCYVVDVCVCIYNLLLFLLQRTDEKAVCFSI